MIPTLRDGPADTGAGHVPRNPWRASHRPVSSSALAPEDLVDPGPADAREPRDLALAEAGVERLRNEPRDRLVLPASRVVELAESVAVLLELGSQRVRI